MIAMEMTLKAKIISALQPALDIKHHIANHAPLKEARNWNRAT